MEGQITVNRLSALAFRAVVGRRALVVGALRLNSRFLILRSINFKQR
jgi:hypothetical protein